MPRNAPNRTDLLAPTPGPSNPAAGQPNGQPIQVPTGLPYGENQALADAQRTAPLPSTSPPPNPGQATPAPAPQGGPGTPDQIQAAQQFQMPNLGDIERPTERPQEPVTAGLGTQPQLGGGLATLLGNMARVNNSPALSQLAARATSLGQ